MNASRDSFLKLPDADNLPVEPVELAGLGTVFVARISGAERDAWEAAMVADKKQDKAAATANIRTKLVILTACEADGQRLFSSDDEEWLAKKHCAIIDLIFEKAQEINMLAPRYVEELAKNSVSGQS